LKKWYQTQEEASSFKSATEEELNDAFLPEELEM